MRIGRLRVIFKISSQENSIDAFNILTTPLAYIEWYSKLPGSAHKDHLMYQLTCSKSRVDDTVPGSIVPLSHIRQGCQLIPKFSSNLTSEEQSWNTKNVLDKASTFYLNNWSSPYAYQTLW